LLHVERFHRSTSLVGRYFAHFYATISDALKCIDGKLYLSIAKYVPWLVSDISLPLPPRLKCVVCPATGGLNSRETNRRVLYSRIIGVDTQWMVCGPPGFPHCHGTGHPVPGLALNTESIQCRGRRYLNHGKPVGEYRPLPCLPGQVDDSAILEVPCGLVRWSDGQIQGFSS
jgi:hypothetical protein